MSRTNVCSAAITQLGFHTFIPLSSPVFPLRPPLVNFYSSPLQLLSALSWLTEVLIRSPQMVLFFSWPQSRVCQILLFSEALRFGPLLFCLMQVIFLPTPINLSLRTRPPLLTWVQNLIFKSFLSLSPLSHQLFCFDPNRPSVCRC